MRNEKFYMLSSVFTYLAKRMEKNDPFDAKQIFSSMFDVRHKGQAVLAFERKMRKLEYPLSLQATKVLWKIRNFLMKRFDVIFCYFNGCLSSAF
jgi:hypothetical protein